MCLLACDGYAAGHAAGRRWGERYVHRHHLAGRDDLPVGNAGGGEAGAGSRDGCNGDVDAAEICEVHAQATVFGDNHIAKAQAARTRSEPAWSCGIDRERCGVAGDVAHRIAHHYSELRSGVRSCFGWSGVTRRSRAANSGTVLLPLVAQRRSTRSAR